MPDHPAPPVAKKVPTERTLHGVTLRDDYAWMAARDDEEVLAHLRAENAYAEAMTAHTAALRETLYAEMVGRIQETDASAPVPKGDWAYYHRTVEGLQYEINCRRPVAGGKEQVLLDENLLAEGHPYFSLGGYSVSPDHRLLAYAVDTTGGERYTLRVKDLDTGELLADEIGDVGYGLAWFNDNRTVLYAVLDGSMRQHRIMRHTLGDDPANDVLVAEEPDQRFNLAVTRGSAERFVFVMSQSSITSEISFIPADDPEGQARMIAPRRHGVEYVVEHQGERFVIVTNDGAENFRVMEAPLDDPGAWTELIAGRDDVKIEPNPVVFADHLVLTEREAGLTHLRVIATDGSDDHRVEMPEPVYTVMPGSNAMYDTTMLRFNYTSLTTPWSFYDYDMTTRERVLVKQDPVLGGFDPVAYVTERIWASAPDGVQVPISLVRRADTPVDGTAPGLLYGYGSYGMSRDPMFSSARLSYLDRGMVYAIAHIRGGGDLGEAWRNAGKLLRKSTTFSDFVACAEALIAAGFVARDRLAIHGGSAGGLLMGAVTNMRPDLPRCVVSEVPFVDVVNTMLDPSLPLTVGEYDEWGNPEQEEYFHAMRSYSPYDNIARADYPDILVMSGMNDPRVQFWEPVKYVAKLREHATDTGRILLKVEMNQGHMGPSGRYDYLREVAYIWAFVLDRLGVVQPAPA